MFDSALQHSIACGLDYTMGRVFLEFFSRTHHHRDRIESMRLELERSVKLGSHYKASHVRADCIALRSLLRQADAPREHFGFLDILEARAPRLAARELSELLRVYHFQHGQLGLFVGDG